jgi:hypothetical protein
VSVLDDSLRYIGHRHEPRIKVDLLFSDSIPKYRTAPFESVLLLTHKMHLLTSLLCAAALPRALLAFPNVPFKTSGSRILDSTGVNFTYVGTNWPGAADVMIPEGLQYASIASIVSKIKSLKMNVVRLTFAIEMIDDIKDNGGDVTIQKAFTKALGSKGDAVYQNVIKNNPQFTASTTRLQVSDCWQKRVIFD